ncbi:tRNA pseudouridine(55) synthase TruB [Paenibacillus methanolicus]|uniref:tRNA pseudouridine synthase B n=1 Tax=Paenibacillus methanolicus TaxID=582686 RepID=A0A5S5CE33_9BACL|nr:tRNA pseudouridine(55) synthase TruB [Paenibacillus methanolicus]TYP77607.1 tRNA pseudouridine55 synthase [Paenibacillus methanolicus]
MTDGILAIWKPAGWTSHDVVAKARGILRIKRIGHTGTLDPQVTGVLPICVGRATRVVEYVQERPKAYEAVLKLGIATDTEDMTGTVLEDRPGIRLTEGQLREALASFVGEIEQVPPMFSAVRVDGKRLYELAREGKVVERKSRRVTIHEITLISADLEQDYPEIRFAVVCSKGTYIRTLCVDIGRLLGMPATMKELVRTMSGGLTQADCVTLEQLRELQASGGIADKLIPADAPLDYMPRGDVGEITARNALQGKRIAFKYVRIEEAALRESSLIRLYGNDGMFLGVYEPDAENETLKPVKVFTPV